MPDSLTYLLRAAVLPAPDLKRMFVWDQTQFSLVMHQEAPPIIGDLRCCTVNRFCGLPIRVDRSLPDGVVEFRSSEGRLLARIVNVGTEKNEMG